MYIRTSLYEDKQLSKHHMNFISWTSTYAETKRREKNYKSLQVDQYYSCLFAHIDVIGPVRFGPVIGPPNLLNKQQDKVCPAPPVSGLRVILGSALLCTTTVKAVLQLQVGCNQLRRGWQCGAMAAGAELWRRLGACLRGSHGNGEVPNRARPRGAGAAWWRRQWALDPGGAGAGW